MRLRMMAAVFGALLAGCERVPQPEQASSLVVEDDAGRSVQLSAPATRIVSLLPTVTDVIIAMGYADRLIARTDYDVDPRIRDLPSIGGGLTPSVEWIAAQQPHLVFSWPDNAARSLVRSIEATGVRVYAARTDTIANTLDLIHDLGVLLAAKPAADSLARAMTSALDSVRASVEGKRRVSVAYVLSVQPPTVAGPRTFVDELIRIAGGENAFADIGKLYAEINLEELIARDPDVIVLARESTADPTETLAALPGWRNLRAVREGRVHRVSPDYFNRSGPLMPRAARELARFFHDGR